MGKVLPSFSDDELKEIGEEIAEIVRQHGLQHSPEKCRELFNHMADVIDGWNSRSGQSDSD